jgi:Transposase DDE domain
MRASDIIGMIAEEKLEFLSAETKADYKVQKLKGHVLFKLILYSLLTTRNSSLRVLESVFNSYRFKALSGIDKESTTRFTSIRDRIATIEPEYFEKLFAHCTDIFSKQLGLTDNRILRYDSTMIALSAKMLDIGMKVGSKTDKKQIKCTIGYNGLLPTSAKVFTEQKHLSEDICLYEAIKSVTPAKDDIVVFDRGLTKRSSFSDFTERGISFVTRLRPSARFELISDIKLGEQDLKTDSLVIESDQMVYLYDKTDKTVNCPLRLIRGRIIESGEPISFLTNMGSKQMTASQITEVYKKRWDIEVFFKFLKQELDLEHIAVRTENGMKVMLYMKLIAAILLTVYRELNKLKGYKLVKLRFENELEEDLIKEVVLICGGDPNKMYRSS